jgi:hypothetical protein
MVCTICTNGPTRYTKIMTLLKIMKLKMFALAIGLASYAIAEEADVSFSMNCNTNEGQSYLSPVLSGDKLNRFRQNVADALARYSCQKDMKHSLELCALNKRWALDSETWLIQTYCDHGAYLTSSAWFIEDHQGVAPLMLKFPTFNWNFKDSEKQHIETIISTGFIRTSVLTDASFDPNTKLISHRNYCCAGDLSTTIQWLVKDGDFNLYQLKVDNIQNGNLSPQIIIFYD